MKYVDKTGLEYFYNKIKNEIDLLSDEIALLKTIVGDVDVVGTIEENNVIKLNTNLDDGTYTLEFFNRDEYVDIVTIVIGNGDPDEPVVEIKNWLPLATTTLGGTDVYDGDGWKVGTRWSNSSKAPTNSNDTICCVTGIVPVTAGDTVYTYEIPWTASGTEHPAYYIKYSSSGSIVSDNITSYSGVDANGVSSFEVPSDVVGVRFSGYNMSDTSMITVNQYPIA